MNQLKNNGDSAEIRKQTEDFIFADLLRRGFITKPRYNISNAPAWFFFGATTEEFIDRTFRVVLQRSPSSTDIMEVKVRLDSGTLSRAQYLHAVVTSPEAASKNQSTEHILAIALSELALDEEAKFHTRLGALGLKGRVKARVTNFIRRWHQHMGGSNTHLSLIAAQLQSLRVGLNDIDRRKPSVGRSNSLSLQPQTLKELRPEELSLMKQRILTEIDRRHRGSEASLRSQLEFYIPYFRQIRDVGTVIDVGCGRGTFLEILRGNKIDAMGFELNEDQVAECQKKGLNVRLGDALEFMRSSADGVFGAVTLFHVIEHLDFDTLVSFMMEAHRVLAPGGVVLIETPNSENLYVSTFMFNVDPTHVKPITYQYISTVLEVIGFDCERLPVSASLHDGPSGETGNRHLDYLLSVSANLSVIGRKT
ncbi:class I SAM-dependent methyltransferase [Rhizobium sp. 42MFCr.1]|uniref:class I SAM-dependent methyltransferase n=1 Tax=Rhizobium sp. 42MFCr.1 TaxID=1048680 RepID=UPI00037C553B|nr:class I SAM-dependent methyltransferase [Rhizobium sp. 42MFCr.1]